MSKDGEMMTESNDVPIAADYETHAHAEADIALSVELAEKADAWIDLQRAAGDGELLMSNLALRYEALFAPFMSAASAGPQSQQAALKFLIKQLTRAQADIFALKSAVLGRDKLVLTRDWSYRDPLQSYHQMLRRSAAISSTQSIGRVTLPMDADVIGFNWHSIERSDRAYWRWSGPGLVSGLMIEKLFDFSTRMEVTLLPFDSSVLPEDGLVAINGKPVEYSVVFQSDSDECIVSFDVDAFDDTSPFFLLEFRLAKTILPKEFGVPDDRYLGICLRRVEIVPVKR